MRIDRDPDETFQGNEAVQGESLGIGVADGDDGPLFAITMSTPGGGRVYTTLDALDTVEFASELLAIVAKRMKEWERP